MGVYRLSVRNHRNQQDSMECVCIWLIAILFLTIIENGNASCFDHTSMGCEYCVQRSSWWDHCRWCELDEKCHAKGSMFGYNQCNSNQVIKYVSECPKPPTVPVPREYYPGNAYDLLKLSTIPYNDDHYGAQKCLRSLEMDDFEIVEWIGRRCNDLPILTYKECVAVVMISHKRKVIVLAYRGTTKFKQFIDEMQSVLFTPKVLGGIGSGKVQQYFKVAYDRISPCMIESMREQISNHPNYNVSITGHSLGGAIASIASARLTYLGLIKDRQSALYTFGMPKVGNRQYALEHNRLVTSSWRVVHRKDPVPHYPIGTGLPGSPLHHRTEVFYPSERMLPTDIDYSICPGSDNNKCGSKFQLFGNIEDHKKYFNIPVGTYCHSINGRKRRSIKSAMWDTFSNKTCRRIKNSEYSDHHISVVNRAMKHTGYFQTIGLFILLTYVLFG